MAHSCLLEAVEEAGASTGFAYILKGSNVHPPKQILWDRKTVRPSRVSVVGMVIGFPRAKGYPYIRPRLGASPSPSARRSGATENQRSSHTLWFVYFRESEANTCRFNCVTEKPSGHKVTSMPVS